MSKGSLLGTFEQLVLLAILQIGDDAYPPLIVERLEGVLDRSVSRGSVYVTLDRLEAKGLLCSRAGRPEPYRGGRPKRFVAVTAAGIDALRQARDSFATLWSGLEAVLDR